MNRDSSEHGALKVSNFHQRVLSGVKAALALAQNQDSVIKDLSPIRGFWEAGAAAADQGQTVVRSTRSVLCDGEALDLVQSTAYSDGWEAWRALTKWSRQETTHVTTPAAAQEDLNRPTG